MKFNKSILAIAGASLLAFSSCIEETFPQDNYATSEQVGASSAALMSSVRGIPSQMAQGYLVYGGQTHETDMGYPAYMIAQTEMLGDMYPEGANSGYDWYRNYNTMQGTMGDKSYFAYLPWFTFYKFVKTANDVISTVDIDDETIGDDVKGLAGVGYASRAFQYYMLTVLFSPVENPYTDCGKMLKSDKVVEAYGRQVKLSELTVPKVTESTDRETAKNNPRLLKDDMKAFILSDLDKAARCLKNYTPETKTLPNLAVVYGIRAKVCAWFEDYAQAELYADSAIVEAQKAGASPVTASQWDNPSTGFCVANQAWMWYLHYDAENMGNLCNFTGWMSGEADWGYSSLTNPAIDKSLFDAMGANDIRRSTFIDPACADRAKTYKTSRDAAWLDEMPPYLALKFRCKEGNYTDYAVGGAVDVPVMRIEEMYFIKFEAMAMNGKLGEAVSALNDFMRENRDPDYACKASDTREFQLEVLKQMRIEFWGEGNAFPVAKRIKPGVMQNYAGTNAPDNNFKINCAVIKPDWNLVIPEYETEANQILQYSNNPDPTKSVVGPCEEGVYAPGTY